MVSGIREFQCTILHDYPAFVQAFSNHFGDPNLVETAHCQLRALWQTGLASTYVARFLSGEALSLGQFGLSTGIDPMYRGPASLEWSPSLLSQCVRIGSPSRYQGVGKARGTQVDIQSEEKASSDCTTIYKLIRKLPDHVTLSGMWYSP